MVVEVDQGMAREVKREAVRNVVVGQQRQIMSRDGVAEMEARLDIAIFLKRMMKI